MIKLGLINIISFFMKVLSANDMITDQNLDVLCLTETRLKPDNYITLNESIPHDYCYECEPCPKDNRGRYCYNLWYYFHYFSEV